MRVAYVLLLLVALAAPGFAQAPDDKLIVPGQRIFRPGTTKDIWNF